MGEIPNAFASLEPALVDADGLGSDEFNPRRAPITSGMEIRAHGAASKGESGRPKMVRKQHFGQTLLMRKFVALRDLLREVRVGQSFEVESIEQLGHPIHKLVAEVWSRLCHGRPPSLHDFGSVVTCPTRLRFLTHH